MHAILAEMIVERGKSEVDPIIYQFPKFIPCEVNLIWWTAQCIVSSIFWCIAKNTDLFNGKI